MIGNFEHGDVQIPYLRPGLPLGTLNIDGTYGQVSEGVLEIEIGGLTQGVEADLLTVSGDAMLGGTLEVTLVGGFTPHVDDEVLIVLAGNVSGEFARVAMTNLPPGIEGEIDYAVGSVKVRFVAARTPGDLNCDGAFNGGDIDPFFLALGDPAAYAAQYPNCNPLLGDMNSDGRLDGGDIDPFFACLGGNCP